MISYWIEDEAHAESISKHNTFDEARTEILKMASIPFGSPPHITPCSNPNCRRRYEIQEYSKNEGDKYWHRQRYIRALTVSQSETVLHLDDSQRESDAQPALLGVG